jgi:hypothetical protein
MAAGVLVCDTGRRPVRIAPVVSATMADIPFIDRLQKMHSKAVGFIHLKTLEGNVEQGAGAGGGASAE